MARCIQLARLGMGKVAPNPMVGAVIVYQDSIIGEGFHEIFGGSHAEVNAIRSVKDQSLLSDSTIYVSLEPCSHHGKTPPCADLLVEKKFKRVVIGSRDANSEVDGKGIQRLRNAQINLSVGVLENECRALNKRFFTAHEKQRPFVLLKWAQTPNGLIDQGMKNGEVSWISEPETQVLVHTWRSENQAILVGRKTVESDNPSLNVRAVKGTNPIRIVLDSENRLQGQYTIFDRQAKTIVMNKNLEKVDDNVHFLRLEKMEIPTILERLHSEGIHSILIEGGAKTLQSFIDSDLWDEAKVIVGQHNFATGTSAPHLSKDPTSTEKFFGDTIKTYLNE